MLPTSLRLREFPPLRTEVKEKVDIIDKDGKVVEDDDDLDILSPLDDDTTATPNTVSEPDSKMSAFPAMQSDHPRLPVRDPSFSLYSCTTIKSLYSLSLSL